MTRSTRICKATCATTLVDWRTNMAKTVADYYRDGHEAYNAGTALPFTDAKSW